MNNAEKKAKIEIVGTLLGEAHKHLVALLGDSIEIDSSMSQILLYFASQQVDKAQQNIEYAQQYLEREQQHG